MPKLQLSHRDQVYRLSVERTDQKATLSLQSQGAEPLVVHAEIEALAPWTILRLDGKVLRTLAVRNGDGVWVTLEGRTWFLKHERAGTVHAATGGLSAEVRAPMTGTVIKVLVEPGARVAEGELLAVMEAMKMEYRLEARTAGTVERVHCKVGDLLNVGTLLVELSPGSAS